MSGLLKEEAVVTPGFTKYAEIMLLTTTSSMPLFASERRLRMFRDSRIADELDDAILPFIYISAAELSENFTRHYFTYFLLCIYLQPRMRPH